ncbi:carbohydrate-binding module family 50 protein [Xylariaceae sp. FL0255]|nr:carbohydrate-binding module family 50 protein [Xylariaceae sp. FL0255]
MADRVPPTTSTRLHPSRSSTALTPTGVDDPSAVRPRNRKGGLSSNNVLTNPNTTDYGSSSRGVSPMPSARLSSTKLQPTGGISSPVNAAFSRGLLEGSWAPSWASVQDFASSLIDGGYTSEPSRPNSRSGSKSRPTSIWKGLGGKSLSRKASDNWGPSPPPSSRPGAGDIAAGSLADREAQLMARKRAGVLESHDGVNGGLDVTGKYKRRNSDENIRSISQPVIEEHLVYLHHVQPTDTYAGIVLRYRCMEHAFRRINGLWSRDNVQIRKQLLIPVDASELKGRPCDPPSHASQKVDHLARTPQTADLLGDSSKQSNSNAQPLHDDYFGSLNARALEKQGQEEGDEKLWTHVRWVKLDSLDTPVEIVRVRQTAVGYFPPRRKKSLATVSAFSTPRQSLDLSKAVSNTSEMPESPPGRDSRRQSSYNNGRPTAATLGSPASASARSRVNSLGQATDSLPVWMRKPGGVGSMGKSVKAPGPPKDSFNSWVNKRLPGFNIDSLPSMSVMGSESAHFGFARTTANQENNNSGIVESSYIEGMDADSSSKGVGGSGSGMGLEQAAASIETWLRGAWAKRPGTPKLVGAGGAGVGSLRGRPLLPPDDLDLIELTDTNSDDGRGVFNGGSGSGRLLDSGFTNLSANHVSSGRSDGEGGELRGKGEKRVGRRRRRRDKMPICIECRHPVRTLWTQYSGAGDAGSNIRLTVYRHLLHNTLMRDRDQFDPSIIRLGTLLLLFDVYLTWARIEKQVVPDPSSPSSAGGGSNLGSLAEQPIVFQYLFFLILCAFSTLAFHLIIRFLTSSPFSPLSFLGLLPTYPRPNSVSTALLVSSSTKLFPILMVIWDYDVPAAARSLGWAVVANNVEALEILLDCGYGVAVLLTGVGAVARWFVGRGVLWCVGLAGVDSAAENGVAADGRALWALLGSAREWGGRLAVG